MTYEQALEFINSRLAFGIKPGLKRTKKLLTRLGDPQNELDIIHVAGTNGKGSTCAYISSALQKCRKAVGLYTSPAITDFRERLQINGEMIPKDELISCVEHIQPLIDPMDGITEFELVTCIAFLWFKQRGCDAVVLETGMGGIDDSTNVIVKPCCSVITHIDMDHTGALGSTLAEIAQKKAGIIKPGCPVVITASQHEEALKVLTDRAKELHSPLIQARAATVNCTAFTCNKMIYDGITLQSRLIGKHQGINVGAAIEVLKLLGVSKEDIVSGIAQASVPARLETVREHPLIVIDGAHNLNGAQALADTLDELLPGKQAIALMGILADKDHSKMLDLLSPHFKTIVTTEGYSPRELSSAELAKEAGSHAVDGGSIDSALSIALGLIGGDTPLIICGSLYLAAAVRKKIIG